MLRIKNKIVSNETFDVWIGEKYGGVSIDETDFPIGFTVSARWRSGQDMSVPCRVYRTTEANIGFHAEGYGTTAIKHWLDGVWQNVGVAWSSSGYTTALLTRIY